MNAWDELMRLGMQANRARSIATFCNVLQSAQARARQLLTLGLHVRPRNCLGSTGLNAKKTRRMRWIWGKWERRYDKWNVNFSWFFFGQVQLASQGELVVG
mmetsp:Transcript_13200/g.23658  ORF Transcript_13200/g.23658 Transcript_13200/m.23658 type:complete len:101 (-) Transcript_13200:2646-2948(-)